MRSGNDAQERETAQWADVGIGPYGVRMEIADARCAPLRDGWKSRGRGGVKTGRLKPPGSIHFLFRTSGRNAVPVSARDFSSEAGA